VSVEKRLPRHRPPTARPVTGRLPERARRASLAVPPPPFAVGIVGLGGLAAAAPALAGNALPGIRSMTGAVGPDGDGMGWGNGMKPGMGTGNGACPGPAITAEAGSAIERVLRLAVSRRRPRRRAG
jgi:hypothetical protein